MVTHKLSQLEAVQEMIALAKDIKPITDEEDLGKINATRKFKTFIKYDKWLHLYDEKVQLYMGGALWIDGAYGEFMAARGKYNDQLHVIQSRGGRYEINSMLGNIPGVISQGGGKTIKSRRRTLKKTK